MPPNSLRSIEPFQLLGLLVAQAALKDAGYADRPFPRERTSVILGAGGGGADLSVGYTVRASLPGLLGEEGWQLTDELGDALPEWTEDSFAGILMNVAAGRIANRLDLGGTNYTVDAACASSLAAISLAVRELQSGTSDMVLAGGIDAIQNPFGYLCFCKTQALSPNGRCRPFDAEADGIAISEGFATVVLKRLADAERDGDRIYAVIKGVGSASDGRDRSLTAPRPEGPDARTPAGVRACRRVPVDGRPRRGARYGHRRRRPGRGRGALDRVRGGRVGPAGRCARLGQVDDRPLQGDSRCRRARQGDPRAPQPGASGDDRRDQAESARRLPGVAVLRQHGDAAVGARGRRPPEARGSQCVRLRRHGLPRRARGVHGRVPREPQADARPVAGGAVPLPGRIPRRDPRRGSTPSPPSYGAVPSRRWPISRTPSPRRPAGSRELQRSRSSRTRCRSLRASWSLFRR